MYRFPHDVAYLPQTKLSYVNLPGLLSDGKRDRTARVPGFVAVQLGDRCYLIFLRDGEPFHAARIEPGRREPVALAEVLRVVGTESERGEGGQIAYLGATEAQLQVMLATLVQRPLPWTGGEDARRPDCLFPALRGRTFNGVVELSDGRAHQYLVFENGGFRTGYFCRRDPAVPVGDLVRSVFTEAGEALSVGLYAGLGELPEQAGPEVEAFVLTEEGRVRGDPVATPRTLTDGVAEWVTEALIVAAERFAVDPAEVVERVARDSRFVLAEQGFFARLPWAVGL
ncbi:MAG TPA: hypothetical protein VK399_04920 [Longimicrobiaceae bacterium]|nr:hypothetical protein [Longimicrobiaceae bacterium]